MSGAVHTDWQTVYRVEGRTLVIDLGGVRRVLSSAVQGGGLTLASTILNHQVESHPIAQASSPQLRWADPSRTICEVADGLGIKGPTVGLMTAVPMTQVVTARAASGAMWVECLATVGVTNAVRAGEWPAIGPSSAAPGTINLIVVTNGALSSSAMVGAVQVATESKTGMLCEQAVPSWTGQSGATGTGTDVVVIVCRKRGQGPWQRYSGTHTILGALIGQVVARCVEHGLAKARQWREWKR